MIMTIEPENLKAIQALQSSIWHLPEFRRVAFIPFLGVGIFDTDGPEWKHSREMLRPNFHRSQIANLDTFETHVSHFLEAIPRDGSMIDLKDLFFRLTMDSATEFLFGESTMCLVSGTSTVSNARFAEAFERGQQGMSSAIRWGRLDFLRPKKVYQADTKYVHDFVDTYVEKGLAKRPQLLSEEKSETDRYLFIDELVRQTDDRHRIRSELLNVLLAGRDTTASLLTNVWFVLSKRPDIWNKLQEEVEQMDGERPTFESLKEMKYLKAILNESLRLHPIVPLNSREAVVDTVLPVGGGPDGKAPLFIKKGQVVQWDLYAMHRRKDFYGQDADEFKPERWLGENGLRPGWEYLPFNGGPRICIGQQFALTEASYTTIRLAQEFKGIESRDPGPWREGIHLTCVNAGGCKCALTPR
ncbi:hypothetical protein AAFC00_004294 [Neodothiora populina]